MGFNGIYPLVMTNIAIENTPFILLIYPLKMVMFHGYVSLPEGIHVHPNGIWRDFHSSVPDTLLCGWLNLPIEPVHDQIVPYNIKWNTFWLYSFCWTNHDKTIFSILLVIMYPGIYHYISIIFPSFYFIPSIQIYSNEIFNGHSRILNWRYLPYIRPIFQAYVSEYPHKIWPNIWY